MIDKEKGEMPCPNCGENPAGWQICPYSEEIEQSPRECECCSECYRNCLEDI